MAKVVEFKHYRINSIEMMNKPRQNGKMQLENKYSYNVKYADNNTCLGELSVSVSDRADPDVFFVRFTIMGFFKLTDAGVNDKYAVHYESYRTLFAYAQAAMTQLTALSGIAPIILPEIDIEKQDIYQMKLPKNEPPKGE
ncbi:MAG: protein-export chaperone SecB [Clostridia bacterium]|nr:protein-export chaperone SecB [Clostridia bacterium]